MNLQAKYSNAQGLADLLENPRRLNPHGRMPSLGLNAQEALDVASALVKGGPPRLPDNPKNDRPGVYYQTYAGDWDRLPDFDKLKPFKKGVIDNLSPTIAGLEDHFGVRHTGFLLIEKSGEYEFSTNSDDGSRFYVGDRLVVDNDGVHGGVTRKGPYRSLPASMPSLFFFSTRRAESTIMLAGAVRAFPKRRLKVIFLPRVPMSIPVFVLPRRIASLRSSAR